jgi:hypothetical protein
LPQPDELFSLVILHCPTCRAPFLPQRTGLPFCSRECQAMDPRQHRFEVARRETERAAALCPPPLPWE